MTLTTSTDVFLKSEATHHEGDESYDHKGDVLLYSSLSLMIWVFTELLPQVSNHLDIL